MHLDRLASQTATSRYRELSLSLSKTQTWCNSRNAFFQICHDARGSGFQLFGRNIVPALKDVQCHTLFGLIVARDSNKTKDNRDNR